LEKEEILLDSEILQRDIRIKIGSLVKTVTQLHVIGWPDHEIPREDIKIKLVNMIIKYVEDFKSIYNTPILIHCRYTF